MNYQETLTLDEYKTVLLFRLRLAAQLLLNAERPGETVRHIQIDTNTAAPNNAAPKTQQGLADRRFYVMFRSEKGDTWPAVSISQKYGFVTFEEAQERADSLGEGSGGYYYVISSEAYPDDEA